MTGADGESFFIPVALDPSPALSTPMSASDTPGEVNKKPNKDYFSSVSKSNSTSEKKVDSQASTPHIAFQEKSRQPSSDYESPHSERPTRKLSKRSGPPKPPAPAPGEDRKTANGKAQTAADEFKLQDAPKSKKLISPRSNPQSSVDAEGSTSTKSSNGIPRKEKDLGPSLLKSDSPPLLSSPEKIATPQSSQDSRLKDDEDIRPSLDSLSSSRSEMPSWKSIPRKEVPGVTRNGRSRPSDGILRNSHTNPLAIVNGKAASGPSARPTAAGDVASPAGPGPTRPPPPEQKLRDAYMQPRAPPHPPTHTPKESVSSSAEQSSPKASPKLPRWSSGGDFSLDEDMARILGTDEGSSSILRRVSNVVRHGRNNSTESSQHHTRLGHSRSVSETTRATASPRWPKTPIAEGPAGGHHARDISSPISLAGAGENDPAFLKRRLRNSENRVAELERQFNTELDLKNLNKKLVEKRKTVSVLDTQTEIMIRQLEVLAGYVERAKETKQPIDPRELEESAIKEFVQKLDKVKEGMAVTIEDLLAERDELIEERNQAITDRDRALLEFEQLSSKNAQLADMNNDLTHQIQERFKSQISPDIRSPNGLGIYSHAKGVSTTSANMDASSFQGGSAYGSTLVSTDVEEPTVVEGPTVVNIRKGQVRKFNWKKGSSKVAQNITKGINRAAVAFQQQDQPRQHQGLTGESIGLPYNMTVTQVESPVSHGPGHGPGSYNGQNRVPSDMGGKGFGFFGGKKPMKSMSAANVSTPTLVEAPTTLFGSDLVERADYERRQIPSVVTRCIEEVELRGMDIEGIYRKTGGNSQVKMLQEGFDKSEDFDISDPAIDITAVTSVLKQYFRKLPVPLLTFDVYERILESNCMYSTLRTIVTRRRLYILTNLLAIQNETERCSHLNQTVNMLPQKHRDCLEFLMFHLARVAGRERENLVRAHLDLYFPPVCRPLFANH